jgi:cell division protein FtsB
VLWISITGYFIFHIFSGARGIISWARLNREVTSLEKELRQLRAENELLENRISRLRSDNLDLDLLEEQAQSIIGFSNEGDLIVLLPRSV